MATHDTVVQRPMWNVGTFLQAMFPALFYIYVYLLVLLPSGSLFGINVKIICFALLLPPAFDHLLRNRSLTPRHISLLLMFPVIFVFWVLLGQAYRSDLGLAVSQYKDILTTFVSAWLAAVYFSGSDRRRIRFLRMVLYAELAASVIKVLLLAYCTVRDVPVAVMVDAISAYTGAELMGMNFESSLGRIQFISDGLIPLCLYMLLRYRTRLGIRTLPALTMFVVLVTSLAFTFSRYFWAFAGLAFLLGLLFGKKERYKVILLVALTLLLAVSFPLLVTLAELRFSADIAGGSDDARNEQVPALKRFFWEAPLFGHGFGTHPTEVIRSEKLPYVYEVQLLALAGQEGVAGLLLMSLLAAYYFHSLWLWDAAGQPCRVTQKLCLGVLLLFWLAAGLLNPMLLNSAAAISYAAIKALAEINDDRGVNTSDAETLRHRHSQIALA